MPEPEPQPYAIQVTILSRVVRGADAEGKTFVRKVDSGCSAFLLALLKERIQGAPILMTRKRQKLRSAKVTLSPNPTLAPSLSLTGGDGVAQRGDGARVGGLRLQGDTGEIQGDVGRYREI